MTGRQGLSAFFWEYFAGLDGCSLDWEARGSSAWKNGHNRRLRPGVRSTRAGHLGITGTWSPDATAGGPKSAFGGRLASLGGALSLPFRAYREGPEAGIQPSLWTECRHRRITRLPVSAHPVASISGPFDGSRRLPQSTALSSAPQSPWCSFLVAPGQTLGSRWIHLVSYLMTTNHINYVITIVPLMYSFRVVLNVLPSDT